jgi:ketosteroid isomerase-like protein
MTGRWNGHDLTGYLAVYWDSPQLIVVVGDEQHQGWEALKAAYVAKYSADPNTMGSIENTRVQIRITKPGLALAQTSWTVKYPNSTTQAIGSSTLNLQKIEGEWKIVGSYARYSYTTSRGWEYDSIQPESRAGTSSPQQDDIKSINDTLIKMLDRWNAHDLDGYLSAYWDSPELLVIIQEEQYQGWQSLKAAYKTGYADPNTMGVVQPSRIQIKLIRSDLAAAVTWWTVSYSNSKVRVVGNTTMTFQKFSEGWKIAMEHSSIAEP